MWWQQEWHVWVGLVLGLAGLGVGIGAWRYAARASSTAIDIQDEVTNFKSDLEERLSKEKELVETEPVVPKRASLGLGKDPHGELTLVNYGEGAAHDVRLDAWSMNLTILGQASWSRIEPGSSVPIVTKFTSTFPNEGEAKASWIENASGQRTDRTIAVPRTASNS